MSHRAFVLAAYTKLLDAIEAAPSPPLIQFIGYEYAAGHPELVYDWQEQDFTRELVNAFNQYAYWTNRIADWERVLVGYSDDDARELRYEFTTVPLDYCLHCPYKFKSRLAFCATQLCYTKAVAAKLIKKEEVQAEERINLGTFIAAARHWPAGLPLAEALKSIDADPYRQATSNYRNKSQHRHPQRLDYGHIANVVRSFPGGSGVRYAFGEAPPLTASDALPVLEAEAERMRLAFLAYRALIEEHTAVKKET